MMRRQSDDKAGELLAAYLRHVEETTSNQRAAPGEIVIVLPERADVVDRRTDGGATEIKLRIEHAT